MKTRVPRVGPAFAALSALLLLLTGGNVAAAGFSGLYAFGDSLSDVGSSSSAEMSLYKLLLNNCDPSHSCPPYFEGRLSNGPVATEYLAGSLFPAGVTPANFHSYAVAGATSGVGNSGDGGTATEPGQPLPFPIPGVSLPGMKQQLEEYMGDSNSKADPDALYFLWGGANDYLSRENLPVVDAAQNAAKNIGGYVSDLAEAGARHFLVPNRGDLSQTPLVSALGEPAKADARLYSLEFNKELAMQLEGVNSQFPAADIFQFDTYSFLNGVVANPLDYGFTDVQHACLAVACGTPETYLYWDELHPTTYAHSVIASAFVSAVPEPGIFVMFIGGLFVLGIAGSRRRDIDTREGRNASTVTLRAA